ncbi:MAG: flavin reductase [Caldilineales bacterium]|nr:flavin reductase [Caldilineales bacterium]
MTDITANSTTVDAKAYRQTIGLFATGVTVLLAEKDGEVRGMTANAVSSLSLNPTLVIVCPSKKAHLSEFLHDGAYFTINILGEDQEPISNHFAGGWGQTEVPEYEFIPWDAAGTAPRLGGCIGALACCVYRIHDGGDHWIVVGRVLDLHQPSGPYRPLLFYAGKYDQLRRQEMAHLMPSADAYE